MKKPTIAILGNDEGPWQGVRRWLVLAPHPDDFDVVTVTLRWIAENDAELFLEVLTGGASGVENVFAATWEEKTMAREAEQRASCRLFELEGGRLRFHRFTEDETGHMRDDTENEMRVREILDRISPDGVILPHGSDTNSDHRRTFRFFDNWAREQPRPVLALLVRDPKTIEMRIDLIKPFGGPEAEWKSEMLRCHASQQERNLRSRGYGLDERILRVNRAIAEETGIAEKFAEGFEVATYQAIRASQEEHSRAK